MDKLDLAWDTLDFYILEIADYEAKHLNIVNEISNLVENHADSYKYQRKRLKNKFNKNLDCLLVLYKKQLNAIDDLIALNEDYIDIPPEKEIDTQMFFTLKNVTATLLEEMSQSRSEYLKYLN